MEYSTREGEGSSTSAQMFKGLSRHSSARVPVPIYIVGASVGTTQQSHAKNSDLVNCALPAQCCIAQVSDQYYMYALARVVTGTMSSRYMYIHV